MLLMGVEWEGHGGGLRRCTGAPSWCSQHFNPVLTFTVPASTWDRMEDTVCRWLAANNEVFFFCCSPLVIKCHTCWAGFPPGGEAYLDINNAPVKVCECECVRVCARVCLRVCMCGCPIMHARLRVCLCAHFPQHNPLVLLFITLSSPLWGPQRVTSLKTAKNSFSFFRLPAEVSSLTSNTMEGFV